MTHCPPPPAAPRPAPRPLPRTLVPAAVRRAAAAACVAIAGSLAGCASPGFAIPPEAPPAPVAGASIPVAAPRDYVLTRGDVIAVRFYYNAELNEELPIRPDGRIALPLVGELMAAGRTPAQLAAELTERYRVPLRQADVAVIVKDTPGRRVYVGGEVTRPGLVRFPGGITAVQAIMEVGGFTRDAVRNNVVVLRDQGTATPDVIIVNLASNTAIREADVVLRPDDVVFVPRTRVARANQFVDQYVRQILPITLSMGLSYVLGDRVFR